MSPYVLFSSVHISRISHTRSFLVIVCEQVVDMKVWIRSNDHDNVRSGKKLRNRFFENFITRLMNWKNFLLRWTWQVQWYAPDSGDLLRSKSLMKLKTEFLVKLAIICHKPISGVQLSRIACTEASSGMIHFDCC